VPKSRNGKRTNLTDKDVAMARAFYPILVKCAKQKRTLFYGELLALAKRRNPNNAIVQEAVFRHTGRRLSVVRDFTNERGYPDLTALVVKKDTEEASVEYQGVFDPVATRKAVFALDWQNAAPQLYL
jgi:hypothetical protein